MDNYTTPEWIKYAYSDWYDPCPLNPEWEIDGLMEDWEDKTYVNPPYSNPLPWVMKAIEENKKGKYIVMLLKLDCSTKWFKELVNAQAHILFINERVKFNGMAPPFSSMLVILE